MQEVPWVVLLLMSRHSGPGATIPPDDQRCEALVVGHPSWNWEWMRVDHRCPKVACQSREVDREIVSVCHVHARARSVRKWRGDSDERCQDR